MEEVLEGGVELRGLLEVDGVTGLRQHEAAAARHRPLQEERELEGRIVLVADDDQDGRAEPLEFFGTLEEGRAAALHAEHRQRVAAGRAFGELPPELLPSARILFAVLEARRPGAIELGHRGHAFTLDPRREGSAIILEFPLFRRIGAAAAATRRDGERERKLRVADAELEGG